MSEEFDDEKGWLIDFRVVEGRFGSTLTGADFIPDFPIDEWKQFRSWGTDKNKVIEAIIAKLNSLRD